MFSLISQGVKPIRARRAYPEVDLQAAEIIPVAILEFLDEAVHKDLPGRGLEPFGLDRRSSSSWLQADFWRGLSKSFLNGLFTKPTPPSHSFGCKRSLSNCCWFMRLRG